MECSFLRAEHCEQARIVENFVIDLQVGDAEVMERRQHIVFQCVLQSNTISDDMVE